MFSENSQNSQGNTCARVFNKVAGLRPGILLKRDSGRGFFGEFCKVFKNTFPYRRAPNAGTFHAVMVMMIR